MSIQGVKINDIVYLQNELPQESDEEGGFKPRQIKFHPSGGSRHAPQEYVNPIQIPKRKPLKFPDHKKQPKKPITRDSPPAREVPKKPTISQKRPVISEQKPQPTRPQQGKSVPKRSEKKHKQSVEEPKKKRQKKLVEDSSGSSTETESDDDELPVQVDLSSDTDSHNCSCCVDLELRKENEEISDTSSLCHECHIMVADLDEEYREDNTSVYLIGEKAVTQFTNHIKYFEQDQASSDSDSDSEKPSPSRFKKQNNNKIVSSSSNINKANANFSKNKGDNVNKKQPVLGSKGQVVSSKGKGDQNKPPQKTETKTDTILKRPSKTIDPLATTIDPHTEKKGYNDKQDNKKVRFRDER